MRCIFIPQIIVNHMRDQVQKLTKEVSDLKESLQGKEQTEKDLNKTIVSYVMSGPQHNYCKLWL